MLQKKKQDRRPSQTTFDATITDTLKHYTDTAWLGNHNPLATPYFLGTHLAEVENPDKPEGRGQALQRVVAKAADAIWPGELPQTRNGLMAAVAREREAQGNTGPRYHYLLLDLRYLRRYFPSRTAPNVVGAMPRFLGVGRGRFFDHLNTAREMLGQSLLRIVQPGLRLEQPVPAGNIIGRDHLLAQSLNALREGRSVALTGPAGIGKTTLGSAIVSEWRQKMNLSAVYWYTFRPGLNDDLDSILFTLAHFMHQNGCPNLWLYLTTSESGSGNKEQALGFLREDFRQAADQNLLLCFDEIDLLTSPSLTTEPSIDNPILELIHSLQDLAPVLLIGQKIPVESDTSHILPVLSVEETRGFIQQFGGQTSLDARTLHLLADGNPRLMELILTLTKSAQTSRDRLSSVLDFSSPPGIEPVFQRVWNRLSPGEKDILVTLSAFRSSAPLNVFQKKMGFKSLKERRLLKIDGDGGVTILPIFQQIVYGDIPSDRRQTAHIQAANIRNEHGRYTEAAYHFWTAQMYGEAVDLWHTNQALEIAQGKSAPAYAIFCQPDPPVLENGAGRKLASIRSTLFLMRGENQAALGALESVEWPQDDPETIPALERKGDALFRIGDIPTAVEQYEEAIKVLNENSRKLIFLHQRKGRMFVENAMTASAEREIVRAEYELNLFKGVVKIQQGDFKQARTHFDAAIKLANDLDEQDRLAEAHQKLAMAYGSLGDINKAENHAGQANLYYEKVGDRLQMESLRADLAGYYLYAGRFEKVVEIGEPVLAFFEAVNHTHRICVLCSDLAEAYFMLGQIEKAETRAMEALETNIERVRPFIFYTLGLISEKKEDDEQATSYFLDGIESGRSSGNQFIKAYNQRELGRLLIKTGEKGQGTDHLIQALTIFANLRMDEEIEKTRALFPGSSMTA